MGKLVGSFGKFLQHQAKTAPGMTRRGTENSLAKMRESIQDVTPVRSGRLRRSMKKSRVVRRTDGRPGWEGEVYSNLSYAFVVNQGRRAQRITAAPGKWFVVGGKRVKTIDQEAFSGRRMFQKGAFLFSREHGVAVLVENAEEWVAASMLKTGAGRR